MELEQQSMCSKITILRMKQCKTFQKFVLKFLSHKNYELDSFSVYVLDMSKINFLNKNAHCFLSKGRLPLVSILTQPNYWGIKRYLSNMTDDNKIILCLFLIMIYDLEYINTHSR